jgi:hypothetical protein
MRLPAPVNAPRNLRSNLTFQPCVSSSCFAKCIGLYAMQTFRQEPEIRIFFTSLASRTFSHSLPHAFSIIFIVYWIRISSQTAKNIYLVVRRKTRHKPWMESSCLAVLDDDPCNQHLFYPNRVLTQYVLKVSGGQAIYCKHLINDPEYDLSVLFILTLILRNF